MAKRKKRKVPLPKGKARPDLGQYSLNEIAAGVLLQRDLLGRSESRSESYANGFMTVTMRIVRTRKGDEKE